MTHCWVCATEEMVVLVYAVLCTWNLTQSLRNLALALAQPPTPPQSDAHLRVSMESLRVRECYSKMKNENEKKMIKNLKYNQKIMNKI